jgi:protocatechuate 3,4-dioxygenase beta subunit
VNARISTWTLGAALLTGALAGANAQAPRDNVQPNVRRIPVGSGTISGVVLSADTGRPIRNARVSLSGQAGVVPAGRGIAPPTRDGPSLPTLSISRAAASDEQGRFAFGRLAPGRYSVSVFRDGYLNASYGQRRPNAGAFPAIELADGEQRAISIALLRGGVLAGRVFDEDGEPMRNVQIQVWRFDRSTGVTRLQQMAGAQTNDRGAYRAFGLQPGSYLVSAVPRSVDSIPEITAADAALVEQAIATGKVQRPASGPAYVTAPLPVQITPTTARLMQPPAYLPVYFPGTLTASAAQVLTITGSEELDGLDIPLRLVRATIVRGVVAPPSSGVFVQVSLIPLDGGLASPASTGVNSEDGTFVLNNVAPGRYRLLAQTQFQSSRLVESARVIVDGKPVGANTRIRVENLRSTPEDQAESRMWAAAEVVVSGEPSIEVSLALQPGRVVSGRLLFDMVSPPNGPQGTINLQPVPSLGFQIGPAPQAAVAADGTFTVKGVVPGRYYVRASWTMRSVTLGRDDLLELPIEIRGDSDLSGLEIVVTDKSTEVYGTLTDASENPVGNHAVVIVPADERYWLPGSRRILTATSGPYGRYTFRLPPGDYLVAPVDELEDGAPYAREFLEMMTTRGSRIRVEEGGSVRQDFRVR